METVQGESDITGGVIVVRQGSAGVQWMVQNPTALDTIANCSYNRGP